MTMQDPVEDRRRRLEEARDWLHAAGLAAAENAPMVLPQIVAQYRATLADLAALKSDAGKVPVKDELKARRAGRRAASKAVAPPARRTNKRGG